MLHKYLIEKPLYAALWLGSFFLFGIIGHSIAPLFSIMLLLTPWILLICGLGVLYADIKEKNTPLLLWVLAAYLLTFLLEVAGVKTGLLFGSYNYGTVLGLSLWGVPLLIGFNWVLVVLGIYSLLERTPLPSWSILLLTALMATLFDFIMEPVAVGLGYWIWHKGDIPLQNYAMWFLIALLCALMLKSFKASSKTLLIGYYVVIQSLFFIGLNLLGFWGICPCRM